MLSIDRLYFKTKRTCKNGVEFNVYITANKEVVLKLIFAFESLLCAKSVLMGQIGTIKRKNDIDEVARKMFKYRENILQTIITGQRNHVRKSAKKQTFENGRYRPKADLRSFFLI
jgi:hypothetical protein